MTSAGAPAARPGMLCHSGVWRPRAPPARDCPSCAAARMQQRHWQRSSKHAAGTAAGAPPVSALCCRWQGSRQGQGHAAARQEMLAAGKAAGAPRGPARQRCSAPTARSPRRAAGGPRRLISGTVATPVVAPAAFAAESGAAPFCCCCSNPSAARHRRWPPAAHAAASGAPRAAAGLTPCVVARACSCKPLSPPLALACACSAQTGVRVVAAQSAGVGLISRRLSAAVWRKGRCPRPGWAAQQVRAQRPPPPPASDACLHPLPGPLQDPPPRPPPAWA